MPGLLSRIRARGRRRRLGSQQPQTKPQARTKTPLQSRGQPGAIKGLMGRRTQVSPTETQGMTRMGGTQGQNTQVSPVEQQGMRMGTGQPKTTNPTGRGGVLGMLAQKMAGGLANRRKKRGQMNTMQGQMRQAGGMT